MAAMLVPTTIPVILDNIAVSGLGTLIYFCFEATGPAPDWTLGREQLPFYMLGLQGIVYRPARSEQPSEPAPDRFLSPDLIDLTFDALEENSLIHVETSRLWMPLPLLRAANPNAAREDVYRLRYDVFLDAFRYSRGPLDLRAFLDRMNQHGSEAERLRNSRHKDDMPVHFSEVETKAFHAWSEQHIAEAIEQSEE